MNQNFISRWVT